MSNRRTWLSLGLRVLAGLCGVAAGLVLVRMLFRLLMANPANPLTSLLFAVSRPLLFPWERLWPLSNLPDPAVERAALVALAVYLGLGVAFGLLGQVPARSARTIAGAQEEDVG